MHWTEVSLWPMTARRSGYSMVLMPWQFRVSSDVSGTREDVIHV